LILPEVIPVKKYSTSAYEIILYGVFLKYMANSGMSSSYVDIKNNLYQHRSGDAQFLSF
jgi:hypothetical protein